MTTTTKQEICEKLKSQVVQLIRDLMSILPNEENKLMMVFLFFQTCDSQNIMDEFKKWVHPWKVQISDRDMKFFFENDHVFGPLPSKQLEYMRQKLRDGTIDDDNKEILWDYFNVFVKLMDRYDS